MDNRVSPKAIQDVLDWVDAELGRNYRKYVGGQMTKVDFEIANRELLKLGEVIQQQVEALGQSG